MPEEFDLDELRRYGLQFEQIATQQVPALIGPQKLMGNEPLSQGVSIVHNEMSSNGVAFKDAMTEGMINTGTVLLGIHENYANIDQGNADSVRKLFAPPPGEPGGAAPEGGR